MNRIADLLLYIEFQGQHPDNPVMQALALYQQKYGQLSSLVKPDELPTDFLSRDERKAVLKQPIDFALYRVLLARSVIDELKGGRITVRTSHNYQAIEDYLIDDQTWRDQKQTLLEGAGLRSIEHWPTVRADLETKLSQQISQTFDAINAEENQFVRKRKKGGLRFLTPKKETDAPVINFYPHEYYVSIFEVLHTVNRSIHANYSAKYFGKDKGITVYSFISGHYPVFYTTVFSSGDFEAWYVLDGLLHNALTIPAEPAHSTDTHGVTELNFALTYLLGMAFKPRIKAFHRATLFTMPGYPFPNQPIIHWL